MEHRIKAIIGQMNEGKSNLLNYLIGECRRKNPKSPIYAYGVSDEIRQKYNIYTLGRREEIEHLHNSFIFLDEFDNLLKTSNRREIDNLKLILRELYHKKNTLVLCGLPFDFNRFICGYITIWYIKKCTIKQLINGSRVSEIVQNYKGKYRSCSLIDIPTNEVLIIDELLHKSYIESVPYIEEFDFKKKVMK